MASSGQKIGLFGGSFNPPHEGHVHVAEQAIQKLKLDFIWWIVTPGNPLKDQSNLAPLGERLSMCRSLANHPGMKITAFEARISTRYTIDTLRHVKRRYPSVNFVWVMGADNLDQFHHWERWQEIANMMPMAVVDRPGSTSSRISSQAAHDLSQFRIKEESASVLAEQSPPAWSFLHGPRNPLSSTLLRQKRGNR